jgi:hypothetical protein
MSDIDDVRRLAALHRLVDNLPTEALDAAFRVLENFAKWPPKGFGDAQQTLEQARERFIRNQEEHARRTGTGYIAGTGGGGSFSPDGYGHSLMGGWEGHTYVAVNVHFFRGHEFHTIERLSLTDDGKTLVYGVEAKLPDGTPQVHQFEVDLH